MNWSDRQDVTVDGVYAGFYYRSDSKQNVAAGRHWCVRAVAYYDAVAAYPVYAPVVLVESDDAAEEFLVSYLAARMESGS
jgi:hypothetical protein